MHYLTSQSRGTLAAACALSAFAGMTEQGLLCIGAGAVVGGAVGTNSSANAKTAMIDAAWSTVSSANIDTRSFLHNYELNLVVYDLLRGKAMEDACQENLHLSTPVDIQGWEARPTTEKLKEWCARKLGYRL